MARNGRSEPKLEGDQPRNWCLSGCKQACQANRPAPARGLHPIAVCLSLCQLWDQVAEGRLTPKVSGLQQGGPDGMGRVKLLESPGEDSKLVWYSGDRRPWVGAF